MAISDYSTTAASNTTIASIDVSGTTGKVSDGDNVMRAMAADMKAGLITGYTITTTAAGTTTLTVASNSYQYFSGSTTQTITMPVTSTLELGRTFVFVNVSTGVLTVNSSGGNLIGIVPPGDIVTVRCTLLSGTTAASWHYSTPRLGTVTNNSASAGFIGEILSTQVAAGSAVGIATGTPIDIAAVSLTAGDWDVTGQVYYTAAATTSITTLASSLSATTATMDNTTLGAATRHAGAAFVPGAAVMTYPIGPLRVSLAATTTYYLVASANFTVSTLTGHGIIRARRVR
jgi:hypothetical protein